MVRLTGLALAALVLAASAGNLAAQQPAAPAPAQANPLRFASIGSRIMGDIIENVEIVDLDTITGRAG